MEVYRFINYDKSNSCPDRIVDRLCHEVLIKKGSYFKYEPFFIRVKITFLKKSVL